MGCYTLKKVCRICGKEFESKGKFPLCDDCKIQCCVICGKEFTPAYPYNGKCCSNQCRAELRKKTNLEKYGVDNPSKRPEVKKKIQSTFEQKYGGHPMATKEVQDKAKLTNLERYGVEHAAQNETIKAKVFSTQFERYGGTGYGSEAIRHKIQRTNMEKYGANTPFESEKVQETIKQVNLEKYGNENPMKNPEVVQKLQSTFQDLYGTPWAIGSDIVRSKISDTVLQKYGVACILDDPDVRNKIQDTMLHRYGTIHPAQNPEVLQKTKETIMRKYGVTSYTQTMDYRKKVMKDPTKADRYEEFMKSPVQYIQAHYRVSPTIPSVAKDLGVCEGVIYNWVSSLDIWDLFEHKYSSMENEVNEFLLSLGVQNVVRNDRQVIKPLEIDLYLPDYKFGIECNPTDTHNSSFLGPFEEPPKPYTYHQVKTKAAIENGITLFHIFGWEWKYRRPIIESMIKNALGLCGRKVPGRRTYVCEVPFKECVQFLVANHRQGSTSAPIRLGLRDASTDELLSVMTFNRTRSNQGATKTSGDNEWELSRFCTKLDTIVHGGASKLFKYFLSNYHPYKVVSFSDAAHTRGALYGKLGFSQISWSSPDYVWVRMKDDKAFNRSNTMKSNLSKFLGEEVDLSQTEKQIMEAHGFAQVFDSGVIRWEYVPPREV